MDKWSYEFGCGSIRYMAPECISSEDEDVTDRKGYSPAQNDVWSLGIILVNLLFSKNPWHEASPTDAIYSAYIGSSPDILQTNFNLSNEFHDLLKKILDPNPKTRISLVDLKTQFNNIRYFTADAAPEEIFVCDPDYPISHTPYTTTTINNPVRSDSLCFSDIIDDYIDEQVSVAGTPITPRDHIEMAFKGMKHDRPLFGSLPGAPTDPLVFDEW
jgi:serine/threonine protein kinase